MTREISQMDYTPPQMAAYEQSLPGPYVGERWATFRSPIGIAVEQKVQAWGQIATPNASPHLVAYEMWNNLPFHGRGWTYIAWRVAPFGGKPAFPTTGKVTEADRIALKATLDSLARP